MNASPLILVILYLVLNFFLRGGAGKKKTAQKSEKQSGISADGPTAAALRRNGTEDTAVPERAARRTWRGKKQDDFDYGQASHAYSHLSQKRLEQVNSYLKAGLIDKKEYHQMLERYSREENCFDDQ